MELVFQLREENQDILQSDRDLERMVYSVNISTKHRFVFVETPKAGCSTMKLLLQRLESGEINWQRDGHYLHSREFSPLLTPLQVGSFRRIRDDPTFRKICTVRSPYARALSGYLDKIKGNKPQKAQILRVLDMEPSCLDANVSFGAFVEALGLLAPDDMDFHWMPQTRLLMLPHIRYDLIIKLEQIEDGIARLGQLLSLDALAFFTRVEHGRTDADANIGSFYSRALLDAVSRIYRADIEAFGYQQPDLVISR